MVNTYRLVNPYIRGDMKTTLKTKNSIEAAKNFYKGLSEHFNNNVPKFYFTIQKGDSGKGKFYHFEVKEKKESNEVNYSIQPFKINGETEAMKGFIDNFKSFKGRYKGNHGEKKKGSRKGSRKTYSGGGKKSKSKKRSKSKKTKSKRKSLYGLDDVDSSSDEYRYSYNYVPSYNQPIYYMYYDPGVYKLDSIFIPTFYAYATPYVEINTKGLGLLYPGY